VYEVLVLELIDKMSAGRLGREAPHYAGEGPTPGLVGFSLFGLRAFEWVLHDLADPTSPWFDLGHGEQRDDVLRLALRSTIDRLKGNLGPDMDGWAWGKLHTINFGHVLGSLKLLASTFSRGPYPIGATSLWCGLPSVISGAAK